MNKRIGTIIITISILIGVFIVPINASSATVTGFYGYDNNMLSSRVSVGEGLELVVSNSELIQVSVIDNSLPLVIYINSAWTYDSSLAYSEGTYYYGCMSTLDPVRVQSVSLYNDTRIISSFVYSVSLISQSVFISEGSILRLRIDLSSTVSVGTTVYIKPFLYKSPSDPVDSILRGVQSSIILPFSAVASGFTSVADSILDSDNNLTPFGIVLIVIFSSSIVIWGIGTIFDFLRKPLRKR